MLAKQWHLYFPVVICIEGLSILKSSAVSLGKKVSEVKFYW